MSEESVKKSILVVDDDHSMRFLTTQALNSSLFHVYEATCAQEALAILKNLQPALMIIDVCMPDMDGFELCNIIRQQPHLQDTPILMITGLYDTQSIQHAFESGATDFIAKPVNWGLLPHRVQFLIRSSNAIAQAKQSTARLTRAQKIARLGWFEWNISQQHIEVSEEVCHIFQSPRQEQQQFFEALMTSSHPEDQSRFRMEIQEVLHGSKSLNIEYRIITSPTSEKTIHLHGEPVLDAQGNVCFISGTIQDISERVASETTIRRLAYYDQVTGLPNRGLYKEHLRTALSHAQRDGHQVAVMFLDLDKFKRINDTLGHKAGDI
ncbi:MAG: response regulator, partial [Mariprofundaceae bacterium]|nr:response regulator [Mariprofundaceae bacterium]